jgi:thiamine biosynthesis protein ThiS
MFPPMTTQIAIEVNGEPRQVPQGASVAGLLGLIGLAAPKVAVERNLEIVPRSAWESTILSPGDRLEIVHFIGGG